MPEWQIYVWKSSQALSHVVIGPQIDGSETHHFHHQDQCVQWQKTKDMSDSQFDKSSFFLVCWVMGVENAMQHTSLPPQTLFCAANPKKSSSNCWQAFICHSLMWSYRRILAFTVNKCNKVFSGNQHHKCGVHIQQLRVSSRMCHSSHKELLIGKDV
jgi:hypothetical protein